jgi:photosystem II stability/assembly factor-like uncharacterized protein
VGSFGRTIFVCSFAILGLIGVVAVLVTETNPASGSPVWNAQTAPIGSIGLASVSCPSPTDCVAVGVFGSNAATEILTTSNGGANWVRRGVPAGVVQLTSASCASVSDCIAVGANQEIYCCGSYPAAIIATTDGGATWVSKAVPIDPTGFSNPGTLSAVSCTTATNCVAVGQCIANCYDIILVTNDGGNSWTNHYVPYAEPKPVLYLTAISCATSQNCVAVGNSTIITTADGGMSWTTQPIPDQADTYTSVSCATTLRCVAVGNTNPIQGGTTYRQVIDLSVDGGHTWTNEAVTTDGAVLQGVSCTSPFNCVAVGAGLNPPTTALITTSDDGGTTWVDQTVPSGIDNLFGVSCVSALQCVAVGSTNDFASAAIVSNYSVPPAAHGYWLVGSDGGIFSFGSAQFEGSAGNLHTFSVPWLASPLHLTEAGTGWWHQTVGSLPMATPPSTARSQVSVSRRRVRPVRTD